MFCYRRVLSFTALLLVLLVSFSGCSQSTDPSAATGDRSEVLGEGTLDPGTDTFVLKTFDNPPPGGGPAIRVQLIGSNLVVDPGDGTVSLDVALNNLHEGPLFSPAVIWLHDFMPAQIVVLNPDVVWGPMGSDPNGPPGETQYGFDYSELFGDDGILGPMETSQTKTWRFGMGEGSSFSFAARVEFGMVPDLPRIAGVCWLDGNRNGFMEPDEQPLGFGFVRVQFPDGRTIEAMVGPGGQYSLPVEESGLYTLHFDPMIDTFAPMGFSTPNPLEVLLVPGPDGQPGSFLEANFGMFNDVPFLPVIQFSDEAPDSLQIGSYQLLGAVLESPVSLNFEVAFSGCGPDEAFSLFMVGGFMESNPPQANIVLRKDWESDCDAAWQAEKRFDMGPLVHRFLDSYGPGVLLLNVYDSNGDVTQLEMALYPPD